MRKYNLKSFDTILIHNSKILKDRNAKEYISVLKDLKKLKFCKSIGVSIYEPEEIGIIVKYFKPDIIQAPLSVFDPKIDQIKMAKIFNKK